mgnify:CR=1 FL=1
MSLKKGDIYMISEKRQEYYQSKLSQLSQLNMSGIAMSVCQTIHSGFFYAQCKKNPIVGIRYRCSECGDNYNLCEIAHEIMKIKCLLI